MNTLNEQIWNIAQIHPAHKDNILNSVFNSKTNWTNFCASCEFAHLEMNNELQTLQYYQAQDVRMPMIGDQPWLVGKDVAEALGYSNPRDALANHVDDEDKDAVAIHDGISNL